MGRKEEVLGTNFTYLIGEGVPGLFFLFSSRCLSRIERKEGKKDIDRDTDNFFMTSGLAFSNSILFYERSGVSFSVYCSPGKGVVVCSSGGEVEVEVQSVSLVKYKIRPES